MEQGVLGTSTVVQVAIVVKNIEETARKYAEFLGLPMPDISLTLAHEQTQAEYRGEPCYGRAKLAFLKVGETLSLELIEPDENPSTWREHLDEKGEGLHHIAFQIQDTEGKVKKLESMGMPLLQKGNYRGGQYTYIDATNDLKLIFETLENK